MKKEKQMSLKKALENKENIEENSLNLTNELIKSPLVRLSGLILILIISFIFKDQIDKLSTMTSQAIFNNENILGPVTYFFLIIVMIVVFITLIIGILFHKKTENLSSYDNLKQKNFIYTIYDNVGFIFTSFIYLLFVVMVLFTPCNISGDSMNYTFNDGDRVVIWSLGYEAKKDDVIVFDASYYTHNTDNTLFYIKRVIAVENDVISYEEINSYRGNLYVNNIVVGEVTPEEYKMFIGKDSSEDFIIPADKVLVLGDNRVNSYDSRSFGLIATEDIIGKVIFRFFPFDNIGNPNPNIKQ